MPDINLKPYTYHQSGRQPLLWWLVFLGLSTLGLMIYSSASPGLYAVLILIVAPLVWILARNRGSGMVLSVEGLSFYDSGPSRRVPLNEISHAQISNQRSGPEVILHLTNGDHLRLPVRCHPVSAALIPELERARIRVQVD
ncbi:MAG: hypothetical protein AAGB10_05650 [Pseudomonadota bacterium]